MCSMPSMGKNKLWKKETFLKELKELDLFNLNI